MHKKEIKPEDVKAEDIDKIIQKNFYGNDYSNIKAISKILTFILIFIIYIYACIIIEDYSLRIITIIFGLLFLVIIFQEIILPSVIDNNQKKDLEP